MATIEYFAEIRNEKVRMNSKKMFASSKFTRSEWMSSATRTFTLSQRNAERKKPLHVFPGVF